MAYSIATAITCSKLDVMSEAPEVALEINPLLTTKNGVGEHLDMQN